MLRKTMIVLATAAALTSGLTVDAFAHGGGGGHGGGSGGHGGGFGGGGHGGGFSGGGRFGGAHMGSGFGAGFASSHFAGTRGNFGRDRGFNHDRRFGRGFGFVPGWHYGLYNYGCSYGYPNYYSYSCDLPSTY